MDRLQRLTGQPKRPLPKAGVAGKAGKATAARKAGKANAARKACGPLSKAKPLRRSIIRVSVSCSDISGAYPANADFMYGSQCLTQNSYTCQLSIHILLHARSHDITLRPVRQDNYMRSIELEHTAVPRFTASFDYLIRSIEHQKKPFLSLHNLDELERRLVDAVKVLHANNISFPVSANVIKLVVPPPSEGLDGNSPPKLFLGHNTKAGWATKKLPPTWKADQLASARSLFFIPKVGASISSHLTYMLLIRTRSYSLESLPRRIRFSSISQANKP